MRAAWSSILLLLFTGTVISKRWIHSVAGPYRMVSRRTYDCNRGELGYDGTTSHHMRFSHYNPYKPEEPQSVYGNVTRSKPMNDSFWYTVNLDLWTNNQWKSNALKIRIKTGACTFEHESQPSYFLSSGGSFQDGKCTKRQGHFFLDGMKIDQTMLGFPVLPYGRYRSLEMYGRPESDIVPECMYDEVDIIPKA
ncbi:uncharacterized protein LOC113207105 [Frankliniella occidentalis]|uniref:Uncharacterized protein LOC113207105 n=1 Tax=Frankliniella occidentalis TaxID=133901 RepID=A0A6J1SL75_FRAOC|nr:uncharacterized protein LOC113207105 [Frankliniella occidentalis]